MTTVILAAAALMAAAVLIYRRVMWPEVLETGEGDIRIACVGDSITYGLGVLGKRRTDAYPALLAQSMGSGYRALNYGLNDRTLLSTADRPYFREKLGKAAWDTDAEMVVFMLGSNDCKRKNWNPEQFSKEYLRAVRHFQSDGRKVCVMIPPRIFIANPGKTGYDDALVRDGVAPVVRAVAEECGVPCVDLYALTEGHREWFPDRLHPNRTGNEAIVREILKETAWCQ